MSDIRKILNTLTEMTSGSVASVSMPLTTQRRQDHVDENDAKSQSHDVLEYGNWENSALTTSKKLKQTRSKAKKLVKKIYGEDTTAESMDGVSPSTKMFTSEGKTKNPVARAAQRVAKGSGKHKNPAKVLPRKAKHKKMYEEEITEQDLIISPVIRRGRDRDLISRDHSRVDREVEMARGDIHQAQQNAAKILAMIQDRSEQEGLEGWVQEKIIKASDYLNTVREYLENKGQEQGVAGEFRGELDSKGRFTKDTVQKMFGKLSPDAKDVKEQGVAKGFSDVIKGVKRSIKGKEHPDVVASKHAGRAIGHYNQGDIAAGDKETNRYVKTRDMHSKAKGVAEGLNEKEYTVIATMGEEDFELKFKAKTKEGALMQAKKWQKQNHIREVFFTVKEEGVAEGSEQVFKVVAVSKSNALEKPTTLNVKASSLDEVFERLAINDWYPLEINGIEVIKGKRLKQGVAEGSEQVFKVVAVSKSNALEKPTTLNVKASSLDEVFERLAINDWYPLEINGIEVIKGKRLKQGVAEDLDANQRRVGQLGPTEKIGKRGTRGRLVGGN